MQEVDAMSLEPFDLHTGEHLNNHSPSEYLSSNFKFYLPPESSMKNLDEKEDVDVDALWTKAVDNMFKSSRLFNSDVKEEEKENVHENLLDNGSGSKDVHIPGFQIEEDDQVVKDEDVLFQECDLHSLAEREDHSEPKDSKVFTTNGDQIVPIAKGFAQTSSTKRRLSDLDVNFTALPSFEVKSDCKKIKLDPETGKEVIEEEGTIGDSEPPKNSTFADYSFDPNARLPSFREAFVPALKRISRREKELRKKLKSSIDLKERTYTLVRNNSTCNGTPAQGQNKSESCDQPSKTCTGASLEGGNSHPEDVLSKLDQIQNFETIDQRKMDLSPQRDIGRSKIGENSHFEEKLPKNDLKIHIKQEGLLDCNKNVGNHSINESPAKLLGITSANLKDIEKNIFSFDEGLDILDLERDFPLHSIANSHADTLHAIQGHAETDWSINMSHVSDVHHIPRQLIGQSENEVNGFVNNQNVAEVNKAEQYLNANGQIAISSLANSFTESPVSYAVPLHHSGSNVSLSHFDANPQTGVNGNSMKRYDMLGQAENQQHQQQQELNMIQMNNYDVLHGEKRMPELQIATNHSPQFQHDMNLMKQPGMHNGNGIEGHMIARQIHQSFGADVFGAPDDDGAKILAKYLAQRGSTRPDNQEQRGSMTSAISSLISKSFSQQEAHQRLQSDNRALDFLHAADFENLDLMNEHF